MADVEITKYKPVPVRNLLVEMKDLSELMIDLAYSSALFHNTKLAEEVLELESRVDTLAYLLNMNAMLAARDAEDAEALVAVSVVAAASNKISDAAADIATIVLRQIGIHPIVREVFEKVEEHLTRAQVKSKSKIVEKTLSELEFASKIGVDIIAIRRRKKWIINPEGTELVEKGDILFARGAPHGIELLNKLAEGEEKGGNEGGNH